MRAIRPLFAVGVFCAVLSGCGDATAPRDRGPAPSLEALLADMNVASGYGVALGSAGSAVAVSIPGGVSSATACPFETSTARFVCPTATAHGITRSMYFQLLDASGDPMSAFDPDATAAIRTVMDLSGTPERPPGSPGGMTMTISSHRDQTLSGLLTGTRVLNGTATSVIEATFETPTGPRTVTTSHVETTSDLVLPTPGSGNRYPQAGTITMAMTSAFGTVTTITMAFNGTSVVTLTFTAGGQTRTCTADLSAPPSL